MVITSEWRKLFQIVLALIQFTLSCKENWHILLGSQALISEFHSTRVRQRSSTEMDMFSIQIALYFLSLAFSHRFLARADDVVGCGGFVQSEVEINYSLVQVKYRIKTNLSKNEVLGYKERFFLPQ